MNKEYDVSKNDDAACEMIHKSGQQGVPVIVGFDKLGIEIALKEKE